MKKDDRQQGHFTPEFKPSSMRSMDDASSRAKRQKENWPAYYLDYFLRRPVTFLIVGGLLLEVQPYEPIQPTYFIATRLVNREEIVLQGTEDEVAHKEGKTGFSYNAGGKSTNKEEFVTAGGVALENLRMPSMESRRFPGLYSIGEMNDVDGVTGGFNFTSCWSQAWHAGNHIAEALAQEEQARAQASAG